MERLRVLSYEFVGESRGKPSNPLIWICKKFGGSLTLEPVEKSSRSHSKDSLTYTMKHGANELIKLGFHTTKVGPK